MDREPSTSAAPFVGFNLLGLNDDCIIATLRHLSMDEMTSLARTCVRLRDIARRVFVLDKSNLVYSIHRTSARWRVQKHLATFGILIKEIYVDDPILFDDVIQHCSGTLTCLTIERIVWTDELLAKARPLLSQLPKFHSIECENTDLILKELTSCEELSINKRQPKCDRNLLNNRNVRRLHLVGVKKFDLNACDGMHQLEELNVYCYSLITSNLTNASSILSCPLRKLTVNSKLVVLPLLLCRLADSVAVNTLDYLEFTCEEHSLTADIQRELLRFNKLEEIRITTINFNPAFSTIFAGMQHLKRLEWQALGRTNKIGRPTLPASLEVLRLRFSTIDYDLIAAVGRLPQLKHLVLEGRQFLLNVAVATERRLLWNNINGLETFKIYDANKEFLAECLNNLGSTLTMRSLTIDCRGIDNNVMRGIGRFQHLQQLKLNDYTLFNIDAAKDLLRQLRSIKQLHLHFGCHVSLGAFLLALGAVDTVEEIRIEYPLVTVEVFAAICRFRNLRELDITLENFSDAQLQMLESLDHLEKLTLRNLYDISWSWSRLIETVVRLKSINLLVLIEVDIRELNDVLFAALQQKFQQQKRRLIIKIHNRFNSELPTFMIAPIDQHYVQISLIREKRISFPDWFNH